MPEQQSGEYYYGSEAEQYTFYRLPKALFTDARYKCISDGAKILYGLMLDRMALSIKNGWFDEHNRVYIYFTLEDVQEYMSCQRDKGMKLLAELDGVKGIGLIERVRKGLGKPTIIYVKKFVTGTNFSKSEKSSSGLHALPTSAHRKNRPLEVDRTDPNNNKINNTDISNTEYPSIYPLQNDVQTGRTDDYRSYIMENIAYDSLCERYGRERMHQAALMAFVIC